MNPVHVSIVLDRSGSMERIADDVVGGFNTFLQRQRETEGEARVTLVQFDSQNPFEILIDGITLNGVDDLGERETRPPYAVPLQGIQVRIRVFEPGSRQVREVTLIQKFRTR